MTPAQRDAVKKLSPWIVTVLIPFAVWAFAKYDATNVSTTVFRDYRQSKALDSARQAADFRELRGVVFHSDSVLRKVCAAVRC